MSKFYDRADSMKTLLETLPEMEGVTVIVHRQKSVDDEVNVSLARVGGAVIITWDGGENQDPEDEANLQILSNYTIGIVCDPDVSDNTFSADDIIQAIMQTLHAWNPTPALGCGYEAKVNGPTPVADDVYLIFEITCQIPINL